MLPHSLSTAAPPFRLSRNSLVSARIEANILESGDPATAGPLSKRGHVRALRSRLCSTRRYREISDLVMWIDHCAELRLIFRLKNTENEPQKKRSATSNCSRSTQPCWHFTLRVWQC